MPWPATPAEEEALTLPALSKDSGTTMLLRLTLAR